MGLMHRTIGIARVAALCSAAALLSAAPGCVVESGKPQSRATNFDSPSSGTWTAGERKPDTSALQTYVPRGLSSSTSAVSAQIAPLGMIEYDRNLLPLVSPAGEYLAVQDGHPATTWQQIMAAPGAAPGTSLNIIVYRIEKTDRGQKIQEYHRLDDIGIMGRFADARGFLVESPQEDGSRRIGYVEWATGQVTWLLSSGVNAYASQSPSGRLAWCTRVDDGGLSRFDLYVQGDNEVYLAEDGMDSGGGGDGGSDGGSWFCPVWAGDSATLFAFHLTDAGQLDLVTFDARSAESMRHPMQREAITNYASEPPAARLTSALSYAYQAYSGIQSPAAPDRSPRILFFDPGQYRVFEYDAREPEGRRVRGLPIPSIAAAWHTPDGVVYTGRKALFYQFLRDGSAPVQLLPGTNMPRVTSNPMHPFILAAIVDGPQFNLNLWAMGIVGEDEVKAAAAQVNDSMVRQPNR